MPTQVPWGKVVPAVLASGAYLNARYQISGDLEVIAGILDFALKCKRYDRQGRASYFYRIEEFAQSQNDADRIFLIYEDRRWTFKETYDLAVKYGTWLKKVYRIAPNDIVALDFVNSPKMIFMILGLWAIGAYPATINYNLTSKALLHCIKASTTRIIFADDDLADKFSPDVREMLSGSDYWENERGSIELVFVDKTLEDEISLVPGVREPDSVRAGQGVNEGNKMALLVYTSGTTGLPKAAIVGWSKGYGAGAFNSKWMGIKKTDVYYTCMPLYHSTAAVLCLFSGMVLGHAVSIGHRFSTKTYWNEVRSSNATIIQYVGETCRYLLAAPPQIDPVTGANLDKAHSVRVAFGNGLRADVWERFKSRFGIETIAEFYSATEGPGAMFNIARNPFYSGAMGRGGPLAQGLAKLMGRGLAVVKTDWRTDAPARDPQNSDFCVEVDPNTPGELLYKLDPADIEANYLGYYGNAAASTAKILRDVFAPGDAWFRTGDTVRIDADGRAFFVDRIGDTFRWRSENVSTTEVADALGTHPAISEANVYGVEVPNHDGRAGCAAITLHGDAEPSVDLMRSIALHAQERLPKFAVPLFLRVVRELAATGNNKQQKQGLRMEGVDPEKVGQGDRLFWLRGGTYTPYQVGDWERIRSGEVRL